MRTVRQICTFTLLVLTSIGTAAAQAEKPTRQAIVQYNAQCKAGDVKADFVNEFGTDFTALDLSRVDFSGPHAYRKESNLSEVDFSDANLKGAQFGASQCARAKFNNADLSDAEFVTANLRDVNLTGAKLKGTRFYQTDLSGAVAEGADFSSADITGSDFVGAKLSDSTFAGAQSEYWWSDFSRAELRGVDFSGTQLPGAKFRGADLTGANFSGCKLDEADFTGANLSGVTFEGACVRAAIFDDVTGLDDAALASLRKDARRWQFDAENNMKAFLNSPLFPLLLVIAIPPLAIIARRVFSARGTSEEHEKPGLRGLQFRISTIMLITLVAAIAVFLGIWSEIALCSFCMVSAFYLMVGGSVYNSALRKPGIVLLVAALIYAAVNVGLFVLMVATDPFAIFGLIFMGLATIVMPMTAFIAGGVFIVRTAAVQKQFPWMSASGYGLWMLGIAFANFAVIFVAMASV